MDNENSQSISIAINEAQLVLAEKRTSLAVLRTGIAILVLPLSFLSLLIATSKYYNVFHVLHFLIPLSILILTLTVFGTYLIIRATIRMRHYDDLIKQIKQKHGIVAEFID